MWCTHLFGNHLDLLKYAKVGCILRTRPVALPISLGWFKGWVLWLEKRKDGLCEAGTSFR